MKNHTNTSNSLSISKLGQSIEAGFSTPIDENTTESISLDDWLVGDWRATFMIKIKSNQYKNIGICPNDYLIIERGREANHNDIILTIDGGQWRLFQYKKFKNKNSLTRLEVDSNENQTNPELAGVVISLVRKYL